MPTTFPADETWRAANAFICREPCATNVTAHGRIDVRSCRFECAHASMIASGSRAPAFVRMWATHDVPKLLGASAESCVVAARLRKCQVSVRPTDPFKVIAVVLPETNRADVRACQHPAVLVEERPVGVRPTDHHPPPLCQRISDRAEVKRHAAEVVARTCASPGGWGG